MASIPGSVRITGFLAPSDSTDTYPVIDNTYGIGGYRELADLTERDAIPVQRRRLGMLVYIQSNTTVYILKSGITNSDWEIFNSGSIIPSLTENQVAFGDSSNLLTSSSNFIWDNTNQNLQIPELVLNDKTLGNIIKGGLENNGTNLYYSPSSTERYKVLLQEYLGDPYTVTNGSEQRTFDAMDITMDELANIVFTIINDLKKTGIFQ